MKTLRRCVSQSSAETKRIARQFAAVLKRGDVVALSGPLGAGKTTFVKGLAKGLGLRSERPVCSPTFVIIHEYQGRERIFHLDWYRLPRVEGVDAELAEECFESGITVIEWPERGKDLLPKKRFEVRLAHRGPASRSVLIRKTE